MAANFDFLKKFDKDLFEIIDEAEHLYRDEYFEQCMAQTRRFGENICKKVLGNKRTLENTFDEMLATLKDIASGEEQEKEFLDDLYFLKKHGNDAVHSSRVNRSGMDALECLQHAFEVAINYAVYKLGANENILSLKYDTELLITGKKTKKTLSEKYSEEKQKTSSKSKKSTKKTTKKDKKPITIFPLFLKTKPGNKEKPKKQSKNFVKQSYTIKPVKKNSGISVLWIIVGISSFISLILIAAIFVAGLL